MTTSTRVSCRCVWSSKPAITWRQWPSTAMSSAPPRELQIHGDNDEKVTILDVGRATLEISNPAQVDMIDTVEVGRRVSPHLRVAFEVADARTVTDDLTSAGANLNATPTKTPWDSLNARLEGPGGLQLTVFQELTDPPPASTSNLPPELTKS